MLTRSFWLAPVVVLSLAFAADANAAVTVGQLPTPTSSCGTLTVLQTGVATGNSYTVPSPGVITSWSVKNAGTTIAGLEFRVGRNVGGENYQIVGASVAGVQTPNSVSTYPAQIPVQTGDVIGEYASGGGMCGVMTTNAGDTVAAVASKQDLGQTTTYATSADAMLPVAATLEPDADGDGFGDETQDQCPTNASTHGPCPAPPVTPKPAPPTITAKIAKVLKLSKRGSVSFTVTDSQSATGRATGTINLPKRAKVVRFKTAKFKVAPGKRTKVTLKLSARSLKSVRKALKHHKLKANITVKLGPTVKKLHTKLKS